MNPKWLWFFHILSFYQFNILQFYVDSNMDFYNNYVNLNLLVRTITNYNIDLVAQNEQQTNLTAFFNMHLYKIINRLISKPF